MADATQEKLAILGGPKAVTTLPHEMYSAPTAEIEEAIVALIRRGAYSGDWQDTYFPFEKEIRDYMGAEYCIAMDNGTNALGAAYFAAGVGPGDEVIHPCFTWICSFSVAVFLLGARPVFCEIDPETLVIDPKDVEKRITPRTKAITAVHLHGNICDMDALMAIAKKHNIAVIEDASHCHGAEWGGKKIGTAGTIGCFSMQGGAIGGKPVASGEGGFLITDDRHLYERALIFSHVNRKGLVDDLTDPNYKRLGGAALGLKYRAHPFPLTVARIMLKSLDERNALRTAYREKIYNALADIPGLDPPKKYDKAVPAGYYGGMYMIFRPDELPGLDIDKLNDALKAEGVNMDHRGYGVTHLSPLFAQGFDMYDGRNIGPLAGDYPGYKPGSLPVSEEVVLHRLLGMPVITKEDPGYSDQVITALKKVTSQYKALL